MPRLWKASRGAWILIALIGISACAIDATSPDKKKPRDDPQKYIELYCGPQCFDGGANQEARNRHASKAIRATFEWRERDGRIRTTTRNFEPGHRETITYCNCGAVKVTGARYLP
jgi:hypothetical protein